MTASRNLTRIIPVPAPQPPSGSETYFQDYPELLENLPYRKIDAVVDILWEAYQQDRTVFVFGNGGSAALASHSACDLGKGTVVNGNRRFRVFSLTDNIPLITAWANDQNFTDIFAEQLRGLVRADDVVLAISGSGNSKNVLTGLQVARDAGARTVGLTGFQGGQMKFLCDLCVVVPANNMQLIEDFHVSVTHSIFTNLRRRMTEAWEAGE